MTASRRSARPESDAGDRGADNAASPGQEARLERAMSGLADEMDSVGENNPRQMASVIRRLSEAAGELASAGKLDEAVIRYLQAVRLDPDRIEAYTLLADAYAAKDREALSEGVLQGALQAHADNVKLLLALGRLHVSWKHPAKVQPLYEKAAKELAEASREAPHAAAPREFLAAILTRRGPCARTRRQVAFGPRHLRLDLHQAPGV